MNATIRSGFGAILISAVLAISAVLCGGCQHMGPKTIVVDRINYNQAVCESWKQQMLLNIVRLRHNDAPVFIEVASIIGGYSIEHSGSIGWTSQFKTPYDQTLTAGGESKFTDRPTITYTPLTGPKFIQSLMKPVDPPTLLFLIQSGWNAETLFQLVVQGINGHTNHTTMRGAAGRGDPEFFEVARLIGTIQRRGGVGMRVEKGKGDKDGKGAKPATVLFFHTRGIDADTLKMVARVKEILDLEPDRMKFEITYGGVAPDKTKISVLTRSIISVLIALSSRAAVPPEDVTEGRARPDATLSDGPKPLVSVHYSRKKPTDVYTSVRYRNTWYWVDDKDLRSKGVMTFLVMLFAIMETGDQHSAPMVTVPAG